MTTIMTFHMLFVAFLAVAVLGSSLAALPYDSKATAEKNLDTRNKGSTLIKPNLNQPNPLPVTPMIDIVTLKKTLGPFPPVPTPVSEPDIDDTLKPGSLTPLVLVSNFVQLPHSPWIALTYIPIIRNCGRRLNQMTFAQTPKCWSARAWRRR